MPDLNEILGQELAEQVKPKLSENHILIDKSEGEWIPKDKFNTVNDENKTLKQQVQDRDKQLNDLKNSQEDVDGLKKQITDLQNDNKEKDKQHKADVKQMQVDNAITKALNDSKAKNTKAVRALLDVDAQKAEFNDDGSLKGLSEQLETLKKGENSSFLFESDQQQPPSVKGASPGQSGDGTPSGVTKEQFASMGYKERVKIANDNPKLYQQLRQ